MRYELNVQDGTVVVRESTQDEILTEIQKQDLILRLAAQDDAEASIQLNARNSAISKLAALGLTEEEIGALLK